MSVWAVIVAAGSGTRFGGAKHLEMLGNRRVIDWSVEVAHTLCDGVIVVLAPDEVPVTAPSLRVTNVQAGGLTRAESVRSGLEAVPKSADIILVHDGARPLASVRLWRSVIDAIREGGYDAAVPGIPVTDTIKRVDQMPSEEVHATVLETVDRASLIATQTPQGFKGSVLRAAMAKNPEVTDDAMAIEAVGGTVTVVLGEVRNIKLTVPQDLSTCESLVSH